MNFKEQKMADNNISEGDINISSGNKAQPSQMVLPDVPDLHEAHCASMRHKYGHHRGHTANVDQRQTDKSSAWSATSTPVKAVLRGRLFMSLSFLSQV